MFTVGDIVYILDSGFKKSNTIKIIKKTFHSYQNSQKTKIEVADDDSYDEGAGSILSNFPLNSL